MASVEPIGIIPILNDGFGGGNKVVASSFTQDPVLSDIELVNIVATRIYSKLITSKKNI